MSEPFVGEIRMFAGNFAPVGWAFCDGQLMAISENDALFALLGTTYGGDGQVTFGLPDLRGRIPIHAGAGPGLSPHQLGAMGGAEQVTLTTNQLASHTHTMRASSQNSTQTSGQNSVLGQPTSIDIYRVTAPDTNLAGGAISFVGGSQSHQNEQPFLCVHFIIALFGIFPSQN
jgi:microcystin-dependent protein